MIGQEHPVALIAEDEPQMGMIIGYILEGQDYDCVVARDGVKAFELFQSRRVDVAVLDVTMPRMSGLELCRRLRAVSQIPIVMVTAHGETDDVIAGFEAGADDYVTKPFEPRILAARVDALVRRNRNRPAGVHVFGSLTVDLVAHEARVEGSTVALTATEWKLLAVLASRPDDVLSWRALLAQAWGTEEWAGGRELVKASIYRLRQRLGTAAVHVETVRGEGYRLHSDPRDAF